MLDSTYRRHALQLASQLPEGREEALAVIEYLRQLVDTFVAPVATGQRLRRLDNVAVLSDSGTSPKRRANSKGSPSGFPK